MYLGDALAKILADRDEPIVTEYDFYVLSAGLVRKGELAGEKIKRLPTRWDVARSRGALRSLEKKQVVIPDRDFRSGVYRITQATSAGTAEDACCLVDPFCYVSHLSAMQRYGLTERAPEALHLTTPSRPIWNRLRDEKMGRELLADMGVAYPQLIRIGFRPNVRRRPVMLHESSHPARPLGVRGGYTRISSIGRTFVDMLSEPRLCGGMHHILDIWENEAGAWLDQIIDEVDAVEAKIIKMRAGYILSERMGIDDPRILEWSRFAQRGGSRKLDPDTAYAPVFSEKWMISLNV